ncbi:MAG: rhodanese-like domain-containing protein [Candidatus Moranbacteria bacterium]|nr:rhodanese-like domain-containing protein [Candidatus Moranbacteria bacterium]
MKLNSLPKIILLLLFSLTVSGCMQKTTVIQMENEPIINGIIQEEIIRESTSMPETMLEEMSYTDVTPKEAKDLLNMNSDIIIIDVSPKYEEGHIPNSVNYYVGDGSLDHAIKGLDKEATYLVYCHVDSASIAGAQKLIDAGFKNVYRLKGNYKAWIEAGYPVEK